MLKVVADRSMDQLWVPFSRYRGPYAITMPCRCLWCIRGARPCWGTAELDQNEGSPATANRHRAPADLICSRRPAALEVHLEPDGLFPIDRHTPPIGEGVNEV